METVSSFNGSLAVEYSLLHSSLTLLGVSVSAWESICSRQSSSPVHSYSLVSRVESVVSRFPVRYRE